MKEEIKNKEGIVVGEVVDSKLVKLKPDELADVLFENLTKLTGVCQQQQAKILELRHFIKNNL